MIIDKTTFEKEFGEIKIMDSANTYLSNCRIPINTPPADLAFFFSVISKSA